MTHDVMGANLKHSVFQLVTDQPLFRQQVIIGPSIFLNVDLIVANPLFLFNNKSNLCLKVDPIDPRGKLS